MQCCSPVGLGARLGLLSRSSGLCMLKCWGGVGWGGVGWGGVGLLHQPCHTMMLPHTSLTWPYSCIETHMTKQDPAGLRAVHDADTSKTFPSHVPGNRQQAFATTQCISVTVTAMP